MKLNIKVYAIGYDFNNTGTGVAVFTTKVERDRWWISYLLNEFNRPSWSDHTDARQVVSVCVAERDADKALTLAIQSDLLGHNGDTWQEEEVELELDKDNLLTLFHVSADDPVAWMKQARELVLQLAGTPDDLYSNDVCATLLTDACAKARELKAQLKD